ncbi:MAG TPA: ABC transporter permease [Gemmatimonadaceae bacterium]|nr:ABC transporter permease [Gemmatimonadaceae bacterium]
MPEPRGLRRLIRLPWRSRSRVKQDIDQEFQFHLEMRVAELRARGLPPDTARSEALRRFGDVSDAREYCRTMDERSITEEQRRDQFAEMGSDLRFAIRQLRRSPAFTALAIVTLALGIGATTAIFSVVHRLILDPIPYKDGDRIVNLNRSNKEGNLYVTPTPKLVEAWRSRVRSLERIATFGWQDVVIDGTDDREEMKAGTMSAEVMPLLAVSPQLGRGILREDTRIGAPKVVVLGYGMWQRRFGGARDVLGRTLTIDGATYTIVGVTPRDFIVPFMDGGLRQLWLPLVDDPSSHGSQALAKMRPGVERAQVNRELTDVMQALGAESPEFKEWTALALRPQDYLGSGTRDTLLVMLAAVGMVLLIACANVANLLMARASTREREFAIRAALGAGRWRIVRQLLTESTLLALAGGALGLLVAYKGLAVIVAMRPERLAELDEVRLSPVVLLVSLGLTMLTGILFGLAPAMFASARDLGHSLKSATRSASGHLAARRFRSLLVVAEVSLSVVLLVGAGLLVRTMVKMQRADIGFDTAGLMSARFELPTSRYSKRELRAVAFEQLMQRMRTIPGLADATWAMGVPPRTGMSFGKLDIEGRAFKDNEKVTALGSQFATPEYLRVLRLPLVAGQAFSADTAGVQVMVNEAMARRYWGTPGAAVGRRLRFSDKAPWSTIVGVARDVTVPRTGAKSGGPLDLQLYLRFAGEFEEASLIFRTSAVTPDLARRLAREAKAVDAGIRVRDVSSVETAMATELAGPRFNMSLLVAFAGLALVLATVGLYGVIAYSVSQRTREMGIRLALGAGQPAVLRLVMSQGARLTIIGLVAGLAGAAALTRLMATMLYGVSPLDPATFVLVGVVLGLVAVGASYFPARRATRVDPVVALRAE